jgi:hypothetical protein
MVSPRDSCFLERFPQRPVEAIANGYLIPVSALTSPEPLNVKGNNRSVNG